MLKPCVRVLKPYILTRAHPSIAFSCSRNSIAPFHAKLHKTRWEHLEKQRWSSEFSKCKPEASVIYRKANVQSFFFFFFKSSTETSHYLRSRVWIPVQTQALYVHRSCFLVIQEGLPRGQPSACTQHFNKRRVRWRISPFHSLWVQESCKAREITTCFEPPESGSPREG